MRPIRTRFGLSLSLSDWRLETAICGRYKWLWHLTGSFRKSGRICALRSVDVQKSRYVETRKRHNIYSSPCQMFGWLQVLRSDWSCSRWEGGGPLLMLGRLRLSPHLCSATLNAATGWLRVAVRREITYWGLHLISEKKTANKHDRQYDFWSMPCSESDYCGPVGCAKRTMRRCPGPEPTQKREPGRSFQHGPGPGDENHR